MAPAFPRRAALALAAVLALPLAPTAAAAAPAPRAQTSALVARAVEYLDGLGDVKGDFTQIDDHGREARGVIFLARPGRARFQYDPPSTLLITSDGQTVVVSDSRLRTYQRYPLASTPLAIFLARHIRLDRGAHVTRVDLNNQGFSITARDAHIQGYITLFFAEHPMRLSGWVVTDAEARRTRVNLGPLTAIAPPPATLFEQPPPPRPAG